MFADSFGRDYLTETGWNVGVSEILRRLDLQHAANVAAARGLMGGPPAAPRTGHPAEAAFMNWLTPDVGYTPPGSVPAGMYGTGFENRQPPQLRYLTLTEVEKLLGKLSDETRPVASVCFYAAARISEALALRWEHVDFDTATIAVPGTKTKASDATVRLLPALARELRAHRSRQAVLGFDRVKPGALVFQTKSGESPHRRNILRAVKSAAKRAGLVADGQEPVGVHDLRHSLAGQAFALGLSPVEVSKMLRHANPQVKMTVYAGMADGAALAAGDKLAAGLGS